MNTAHLSDHELISHTIKFSNDLEKIRLATAMERVRGAIIDDLVDAGMDETYCTFRSEWGGEYHPGRYISLLEDEICHRDDSIRDLIKEVEELQSRTIMDFIQEVNQELTTAKYLVKEAHADRDREHLARRDAERELEVWNVLTHGK